MEQEVYLVNSIDQIPRILSLTDRNPNSPTYGCMYRPFWHDKATDVACAHPQLNVLALAIVATFKDRKNPYFMKPRIIDTASACMDFWSKIQNRDGSFNEHYPNEHSYGATSWTLSSIIDSYFLLDKLLNKKEKPEILESMKKAGVWLGKNEDPGPLTNHQAIAAWSLYRLYELTNSKIFLRYSEKELKNVLKNQSNEGWYLEYDGADIGYLTTSISFLAKLYEKTKDQRILESIKRAIDFTKYFVYPDGSFGGIVGARDTSHFHPHGFELVSNKIPIAGKIRSKICTGIKNHRVIIPAFMDDKYFGNLVIEFLRSYIDRKYINTNQKLPFESSQNTKYFEEASIIVVRKSNYYFIANLGKGGVFKIFRGNSSVNDSGLVGITNSGKIVSSGWQNNKSKIEISDNRIGVKTNFFSIPLNFMSTQQSILSRVVMLTVGKNNGSAEIIKKILIKKLITKTKRLHAELDREILFRGDKIHVIDKVEDRRGEISYISGTGTFFSRYVPASRYFEFAELDENLPEMKKLRKFAKITRIL